MNAKVRKYTGAGVAAAAAASAMAPSLAFAAGDGIHAILPHAAEFFPMLVAFLILWFVLAKFGWPVFEGMLNKREATIRESLEKSEEARQESERVLAEYQAQLEETKGLAAKIVADAKVAGEQMRADIKKQAQAEADAMIEKARMTIETEKNAAVAELQASVADTAVALTSRLIGTDLGEDEHRAIIERYVNEAGNLND